VEAGVRPEKLEVLPARHESDPTRPRNRLRGRVELSSFLGTAIHTVVRAAAGEELTVITQNTGAGAPPGAGTDVVLAWDPEHTFVVTPEEEDPLAA
jgi:hypothetical protein